MIVRQRSERTEAEERIYQILDQGSFMEIGERITAKATDFCNPEEVWESDGVITGYGTIGGKLVYLFSQDADVMGGSFGEMHGRKISRIYQLAIKTKAPVIGILSSSGFRVEEGVDALESLAGIYHLQAKAASEILQVMAICGKCEGGMAVCADMADVVVRDMADLAASIKTLVELLPSHTAALAEKTDCTDDLNRLCPDLSEKRGDGRAILKGLSDSSFFLEVDEERGMELVTGFIRLDGAVIGGIANQRKPREGYAITSEGFEKAASFISLCDKFQIPLLTVTDGDGFDGATEAGVMIKALALSTMPKVNLIVGEIGGSVYSMMNCKGIGADYVFIWEQAGVNLIDPMQAAEILCPQAELAFLKKKAEDYRNTHCSPKALARRGYVDKIISPQDSRKYVIGAFQTFSNMEEIGR